MRRLVLLAATLAAAAVAQAQLRFEMTVPSTEPLHGHLVLVIDRPTEEGAKQGSRPASEPRFSLRENYESAQGFGVDVDGLAAGKPIVIDAKSVGYPLENLSAFLPATMLCRRSSMSMSSFIWPMAVLCGFRRTKAKGSTGIASPAIHTARR